MSVYTVTLNEDSEGNLVVPLPDCLFEGENPWKIGDTLHFTVVEETIVVENKDWKSRQSTESI